MAVLTPGQLIPDFSLPTRMGGSVRISDFRGRRSLVLIFAGAGDTRCLDLLRGLAANVNDIEYNEAKVFLILTREPSESDAKEQIETTPFAILLDEDGRIHRRFRAMTEDGGTAPAVYITDRFGEIYSVDCTCDGAPLPDADSVLKSLAHLLAECPE